jgi:hypothetical protein
MPSLVATWAVSSRSFRAVTIRCAAADQLGMGVQVLRTRQRRMSPKSLVCHQCLGKVPFSRIPAAKHGGELPKLRRDRASADGGKADNHALPAVRGEQLVQRGCHVPVVERIADLGQQGRRGQPVGVSGQPVQSLRGELLKLATMASSKKLADAPARRMPTKSVRPSARPRQLGRGWRDPPAGRRRRGAARASCLFTCANSDEAHLATNSRLLTRRCLGSTARSSLRPEPRAGTLSRTSACGTKSGLGVLPRPHRYGAGRFLGQGVELCRATVQ